MKIAETKKREALLEAKEESLKTKNELEKETKERRAELQRKQDGRCVGYGVGVFLGKRNHYNTVFPGYKQIHILSAKGLGGIVK